MNPVVYVETSVISYLTDRPSQDVVTAAYHEITREWWRSTPSRFSLVASDLVVANGFVGRQPPSSSTTSAMEAAT